MTNDVPQHLQLLYRFSREMHHAVCAALCDGCLCGAPEKFDMDAGVWTHSLNGNSSMCLANRYRLAVAPEASKDFAVLERAVPYITTETKT